MPTTDPSGSSSGTALANPIPATGLTPYSFAIGLLHGIGAPTTPGNVGFVLSWEAAEGGHWVNTARYNPLNTSLKMPGSVNYKTGQPGDGVQAYTSWAQGLAATISTLTEGYYTQIVANLKSSSPAGALNALIMSPWDAGHYSGGFPSTGAGTAYAKAHSGESGGGGGSVLDWLGNAAGHAVDLIDPVSGVILNGPGQVVSDIMAPSSWLLSHLGLPSLGYLLKLTFAVVLGLAGFYLLFHRGVNVAVNTGRKAGEVAAL